jgi:hypothetical protein
MVEQNLVKASASWESFLSRKLDLFKKLQRCF